jgi:NTE family protein
MRKMIRICTSLLIPGTLLIAAMAGAESQPASKPGRPKLGVALSGGGARGLAHVGVLKVMEEAGLRPDFITGTSMGSVVGALYASGYTAAQIEAMVLAEDLTTILMDQVARDDKSVQDKQDEGKFLLTVPIERGQIALPKGMIAGQNVTLLFSKLLFAERNVHDFHKLPIPFECMATDIVTGEDVVMDKGDLVQAVRTSMAIPSVFTPVEREGRLLVDGGVSRNLPVSNLYDMGADVTIAVDVCAYLLPKEKLNNLTAIFDQGSSITSRPAAVAQAKKSDLIIEPKVVDFSIAAFDQAKAIIDAGEAAARAKLPELQALARRLGPVETKPMKPLPEPDAQFVDVADIQVKGVQEVPLAFVYEKLSLTPNTRISCSQIESAVNRVYGSGRFLNARYTLEPAEKGETLVLHVIENLHSNLAFGIHYDSELKAMLLMNGTFQNALLNGAELSLDAYLSSYLVFRGSYLFHPGWEADAALGLRAEYQDGDLSVYNSEAVQAYAQQKSWQLDLVAQGSLADVMVYGIGAQKEIIFLSGLTPESLSAAGLDTTESLNALVYTRLDSLDNGFYPTAGTLFEITGKWLTDLMSFYATPDFVPFGQATLEASQYVPLAERFSVSVGVNGAGTFGPPVNQAEYFFVGGMTSLGRHRVSFLGTRLVQEATPNVAIGQIGLQWELLKATYFQVRGNFGWTGKEINEVFQRGALMTGYGATLGMLTPVGPLEVTVMSSNLESGLAGFFNLGYRF